MMSWQRGEASHHRHTQGRKDDLAHSKEVFAHRAVVWVGQNKCSFIPEIEILLLYKPDWGGSRHLAQAAGVHR